MAYDEELAARFRDATAGLAGLSEKRMMGGLCFMLNGNMLGGADRTRSGEARFMFRVGKENETEALNRPGALPVDLAAIIHDIRWVCPRRAGLAVLTAVFGGGF